MGMIGKIRRFLAGSKTHVSEQGTISPEYKPVERDLVCGMTVDPATAMNTEFQGTRYYFCSSQCLDRFKSNPSAYSGGKSRVA